MKAGDFVKDLDGEILRIAVINLLKDFVKGLQELKKLGQVGQRSFGGSAARQSRHRSEFTGNCFGVGGVHSSYTGNPVALVRPG
jgi:hypothetical protein